MFKIEMENDAGKSLIVKMGILRVLFLDNQRGTATAPSA